MLSTNELVLLVHEDARHIPYAEQFRVKLGCIGKRQESQPSIIALKLEVVVPGRDSHRQPVVVPLFTPIMPYPTPHVTTGLKPLLSCLTSKAGLTYGVIDS